MATLPELRKSKFLTQKALAERIGVKSTIVSAWETGEYRPKLEHLKALCELFEVGPFDIEFPERKQRKKESVLAGIN
jgi:transcriptional regulator with XRE-family HTH domain